jgi:acyl-coenzyme A thioesterase PaaI-like protein
MDTLRSPLCAGCVPLGRCQFGIRSYQVGTDGVARARVWVDASMAGGPRVAHGGWTASIFDEVLGQVPGLHGVLAVTKTLTVDYTRPVPVDRWLRAESRVESRSDGSWEISGVLTLEATGSELARARGTWVERTARHFERHAEWLREQDAITGNHVG